MARQQIPGGEGEPSGAVRASFVKDCYGVTLNDAGLFDLVIGTDKVPAEMATRWLVEATLPASTICKVH